MTRFVLALDQGTTGNTVLVLDPEGAVAGRASNEFPQHFPAPGQVEHNPNEIWDSMQRTIVEALANAGIHGSEVGAIGITNQRETVALWQEDGTPIANAIVWQDRRTAPFCEQLRREGKADLIARKTGLVIDPYFSASKIKWLLDKYDPKRKVSTSGSWRAGTLDTYLLYRLSGGTVHATEPSNASRTQLFDIDRGAWDDELLDLFAVPPQLLPRVAPSAGIFGQTRGLDVLPDGIPISGIAGDQQAALFGQACFEPGQSKCTYGTGAFLLLNTGRQRVDSRFGILTTVAWQTGTEPHAYALEGSVFIAGAAVQWLRDGLKIIRSSAEVEALAASVSSSEGVVFVPALAGLGAPHWRPEARGIIYGLTRGSTAAHIARATLEGIALQITELIAAMNADFPTPIAELNVDGGAAANNLLMQIQADLAQVPVIRPKNLETTAYGAGFLAGLGAGIWRDRSELVAHRVVERRFEPKISADEAASRRETWASVVNKA